MSRDLALSCSDVAIAWAALCCSPGSRRAASTAVCRIVDDRATSSKKTARILSLWDDMIIDRSIAESEFALIAVGKRGRSVAFSWVGQWTVCTIDQRSVASCMMFNEVHMTEIQEHA
uniref:Uncharacterized protein n=1 Tax=Oryza glumipatula TaxID=40148 RepID=A0A0D9ZMK8_9ORYZ